MKLVLLGTCGLAPSDDGGQTACLFLPEAGILLDAGSGLYRLAPHLQTSFLDIYLTHAHTDHTLGLFWLQSAVHRSIVFYSGVPVTSESLTKGFQSAAEFMNQVRIHGTKETIGALMTPRFRDLVTNSGWQLLELDSDVMLPGGGSLRHFPLEHTAPCVGYRLEWPGHSMAYVTDTTAMPDAPYLDHVRGVDVLVHERALPDTLAQVAYEYGHSHTTPVAQLAAAADVGRLILVHDDPILGWELDVARAVFPATELAVDGMEVEF